LAIAVIDPLYQNPITTNSWSVKTVSNTGAVGGAIAEIKSSDISIGLVSVTAVKLYELTTDAAKAVSINLYIRLDSSQ